MHRGRLAARAWALALTATTLGSVSHALGGGNLPHPLLFALATALAALLTLGISLLNLRATSLAAGVTAGQGLLHLLYTQGDIALTTIVHSHHHTDIQVLAVAPHHHSPLMGLTHALAAAATFALLRHGENLLTLILDLVGAGITRLTRLPRAITPVSPARIRATYRPTLPTLRTALGECRITRGPPALLALL